MFFLYRIIINTIFILSPIIIFIRLLKKKESLYRFKEKFSLNSKKRTKGKLIWFHGASVGEIKSVLPLIEKIEKNKKVTQILITSNTISSSKILQNIKSKKIVHQFFPIDTIFLCRKFLAYWKPSLVFFIDSEIWPNMINCTSKKKIPITLLNARISRKTFNRWKNFPVFSREIFSKLKLCFSSDNKSKLYLNKLGVKNIKTFGNLKFSQSEYENIKVSSKLKNFLKKKKVWCASSTHYPEELLCAKVHKKLNKKYKNLLTIIIPRHVERITKIKNDIENLGLNVHFDSSSNKIDKNTDIYIVNSYGKTKSFYNLCKHVYLGGSIINHGGQNPLEAARFGCKILHGPNVFNFTEIYKFLKINNISQKIYDQKTLSNALLKLFSRNNSSTNIKKRINNIGEKVLTKTYNEIFSTFRNEI